MSDIYRAVIPYESLDPLTIGSADDPSMVYRETLTLDIPEANLLAALSSRTSPRPSRTPPRPVRPRWRRRIRARRSPR